jgi:von Willebrand factor type A domain
MKTSSPFFQHTSMIAVVALVIALLTNFSPVSSKDEEKPAPPKNQSIMLALLIDTSNSMDGLIDQAKSQLWKVVNELAAAKCDDGTRPNIKIALYEYGNDGLTSSEGYIRQVNGLTDDLDLISEKLFALSTNGGNEYCGHVIKTSLNQLAWSGSGADLKMIFIAGNEPFTQGGVSYRQACAVAKEKGVIVNTIFCGNFAEGINTNWKDGADLTGGSYMSIEQNQKTVYIPTPYDTKIDECNERLNKTYVYYGKTGERKKEMQVMQDKNAASYGQSNKVERAVSKSSHAYKNSTWDMVDASKENEKIMEEAKAEDLPAEMKSMNVEQRKTYVKQKADERAKIQSEIQALNKQRQEYIATHTPKESKDAMLDEALIKSIKEKARTKKLTWE